MCIGVLAGDLGDKPRHQKKKYFTFGLVLRWGYKQEYLPKI